MEITVTVIERYQMSGAGVVPADWDRLSSRTRLISVQKNLIGGAVGHAADLNISDACLGIRNGWYRCLTTAN